MSLAIALSRDGALNVSSSNPGGENGPFVVFGRVAPTDAARWSSLVLHLLTAAAKTKDTVKQWEVDVSQQYILSPDGRLLYTWRIIFNGALGVAEDSFPMKQKKDMADLVLVNPPRRGLEENGRGVVPSSAKELGAS